MIEISRMEFERQEAVLEQALSRAVHRISADCLLLSGGIDSSLIASFDPKIPAMTVTIQGKGCDVRYAQEVTAQLGMDWHYIGLTSKEALDLIPGIVSHSNSYDIGILNDVALYAGMKYARALGYRGVRTGDGGDDLFGGYSFSWSKDGHGFDQAFHKDFLTKLYPHLRFPSATIAESFGMYTVHPYIDPEVGNLAIEMDLGFKVMPTETAQTGDMYYELDATSDKSKQGIWSKVILRRIGTKRLPPAITNRARSDLEYGSGTYTLESLLAGQISDDKVRAIEKEGVRLWDNPQNPNVKRAHARLREIFDLQKLKVPYVGQDDYECSWCGSGIIEGRRHCVTCGAWHEDKPVT